LDIRLLFLCKSRLPLMLWGCSHPNRYRYRYSVSQSGSVSVSPSGSLSFLLLSFSFDPDPDSDFDSDAPSRIRSQGTRIRKQKMDRHIRGLSRHAVARYRRPRMRSTWRAAGPSRQRAAQRRGYTNRLTSRPFPAAEAHASPKRLRRAIPPPSSLETCLSQKPLFTQA